MENVNHAPPPCWYIEYRDHGRITLRQDEADRALATGAIRVTAYGQAIAQPVPEGMVLVPIEPTDEMLEAFRGRNTPSGSYAFETYEDQQDWENAYNYKAMLEAAKE